MPISTVQLFVSAVSNEFKSYRHELVAKLDRPGVRIETQERFLASGSVILLKLDDYIKECDAVLHLAGDQTGGQASPPNLCALTDRYPRLCEELGLDPGSVSELTYTQWEALLAILHKKKLFIATPHPEATRDTSIADPEEAQRQFRRQQNHLTQLRALGRYAELEFDNQHALISAVLSSQLGGVLPPVRHLLTNLTVPSLGSLFKGREEWLETIRQALRPAANGQIDAARVALCGMGGIGKTRLAVEYAHDSARRHSHSAVLMVLGKTAAELKFDLAQLTGVLKLDADKTADEEFRLRAVLDWLGDPANRGWLLIIDNVDSDAAFTVVVERLRALRNGDVLITTRLRDWPREVTELQLDLLPPDAAISYLLEYTDAGRIKQPSDCQDAARLVELVDHLALALTQAAANISHRRIAIADYLREWQENLPKLLDDPSFDPRRTGYPHTVATTWLTSVQNMKPEAQALLEVLCWLPSKGIPERWVCRRWPDRALRELPERVRRGLGACARDHLVEIYNLSLADPIEGRMGWFGLHQLVQEVGRQRQDPSRARQCVTASVCLVEDRRDEILQSWAEEAHREEVSAVRNFAEDLADIGAGKREQPDDHLGKVVRCARIYCSLVERTRRDRDVLEEWAYRGDTDRLQQWLQEDPDDFRRGLYMLTISTLLARDHLNESRRFYQAARTLVERALVRSDAVSADRTLPTNVLARALIEKGDPAAPAAPPPQTQMPLPLDRSVPLRTDCPYFSLRAAVTIHEIVRYLGFLFVVVLISAGIFGLAALVDRGWSKLAIAALAILLIVLFWKLPQYWEQFLEKRPIRRIGAVFAALARAISEAPPAIGKKEVCQAIALRYRLRMSRSRKWKRALQDWTRDLEVLIRHGFPQVANDPAEIARSAHLVKILCATQTELQDALTAALREIDPRRRQAILQELVRSGYHRREGVLRIILKNGEQIADASLLVSVLATGEGGLTPDAATTQSRIKALSELSSLLLGKALLTSLDRERNPKKSRTWVLLPWVLLRKVVAFAFTLLGRFVLNFGRIHDPYRLSRVSSACDTRLWRDELEGTIERAPFSDRAKQVTSAAETHRIKETLLALRLREHGLSGQLKGFTPSRRMIESVLSRLSRVVRLGERARLIVSCMGERRWLDAVVGSSSRAATTTGSTPRSLNGHEPGDAALSGRPLDTERDNQDAADRAQLRRVLPLRPLPCWLLTTSLSLLLVLGWLGGIVAVIPRDGRAWLSPFAGTAALGIALLASSVPFLPRALGAVGLWRSWLTRHLLLYRVAIGLGSLIATVWFYEWTRDWAEAAGLEMPGLYYGWERWIIPLVPLLIATVVVPEGLALWRSSGRLLPNARELWRTRLVVFAVTTSVGCLLSGGVALLAFDFAAAYHNRALVWDDRGELDKAIHDYGEAIRLNPDFAPAYYHRGLVWIRKDNREKGIDDFHEAIRLRPSYAVQENREYAKVLAECGQELFRQGAYDKSIQLLSESINLQPWSNDYDPDRYCFRGDAWYNKKDYDKAIEDYSTVLGHHSDKQFVLNARGNAWYAKKDYDRAIQDYDEAIRLDPKNVFHLRNRGNTWYAKKDYDRAIQDYDEAIRLDPKDALALTNRGNARRDKGEYEQAIRDYDEAIRLYPGDTYALNNRGIAWHAKKEYDRAIADYDEVIRLDPGASYALNNRGNVWRDKGEYDRAIRDYDEAIRLDPEEALALTNRGNAWAAKGEYDRAIRDHDAAIRLDPKGTSALTNRGNAWYTKREYDRAIADFDVAIRLNPQGTFALTLRGRVWAAKGEYDRAIADFDEVIRLNPQDTFALTNRGRIWAAKGEYDRAIRDHDEAIRLDPKDGWAHFTKAVAQMIARRSEAVAGFHSALEIYRTGEWAAYTAILGNIAARQAGDESEARRFLQLPNVISHQDWPDPVMKFLRGEIDGSRLLELATNNDKMTEARCYLGLNHRLKGQLDVAAGHFRWVKDHGNPAFIEYTIAVAELDRMVRK